MAEQSLISRFQGTAGRNRLIETLQGQALVQGLPAVASELADVATVLQLNAGERLIEQGGADNDVYFILVGSFRIIVNGCEVNIRRAGQHVGEMAAIDPTAGRSATVIASEYCVVARVTEPAFIELADRHPRIWRQMAATLSRRLDERRQFHRQPNSIPVLFVGSSRERLPHAEAIEAGIPNDIAHVTIWTDGVFGASSFPLLDLETQLERCDFGLLIAGPDDQVTSRGVTKDAPRDNVVFELGLFIGKLTHARTLMLLPSGSNLKIPSDLLGLSEVRYDPSHFNPAAGVADAVAVIAEFIRQKGPR